MCVGGGGGGGGKGKEKKEKKKEGTEKKKKKGTCDSYKETGRKTTPNKTIKQALKYRWAPQSKMYVMTNCNQMNAVGPSQIIGIGINEFEWNT